ncbi:NADH-quinone oxidoreductase subunit NuoE [Chloroflexota bacterium]
MEELVLDLDKVWSVIESHTAKVDALIDSYADRKEQLISLLQDVQGQYNYLPRDILVRISQRLDIPMSQVFGVATFFKSFSLKPRGRHVLTVCTGTACHVRGGNRIKHKLERDLNIKAGETTSDGRFTVETARCLGACALGPLVVADGKYEGQVTPDKLDRIVKKCE